MSGHRRHARWLAFVAITSGCANDRAACARLNFSVAATAGGLVSSGDLYGRVLG